MRCNGSKRILALAVLGIVLTSVFWGHSLVRTQRKGLDRSLKPPPQMQTVAKQRQYDAPLSFPNSSKPASYVDQPSAGTLRENTKHHRTYDDVIAAEIPQEKYTHKKLEQSEGIQLPCDDVTVPFNAELDEACHVFLKNILAEVSVGNEADDDVVVRDIDGGEWCCAAPTVQPMEQHFEQRTVKFKLSTHVAKHGDHGECPAKGKLLEAVIKVPQMLFQVEPYSEVTAFAVDRSLQINRVPPTTLVTLPLRWFEDVAKHRKKQNIHMVQEFLKASQVKSYDEWIQHDFVQFVRTAKGRKRHGEEGETGNGYMFNDTHVYASVQLFMREVQPLLSSILKVPYSKQNPGWHRWFNPENRAYDGHLNGSRLALSELSVFDFITMNNDRSPNKNNFVAGGCKNCARRRPSGVVPTFVHLDQGMAFYGSSHLLHNPLGKPEHKNTFCMFYRPLVDTLRKIQQEGVDAWFSSVEARTPAVALDVIGRDKLRQMGKQITKVVKRVDHCLEKFPETVVLGP